MKKTSIMEREEMEQAWARIKRQWDIYDEVVAVGIDHETERDHLQVIADNQHELIVSLMDHLRLSLAKDTDAQPHRGTCTDTDTGGRGA